MLRFLRFSLLILLSFTTAACHSMRVVAEGHDAVQLATSGKVGGLRAGDRLLITTMDGAQIKVHVKALESNGILGDIAGREQPSRIPDEQIARIEREDFSGKKTYSVVGGLSALVLIPLILWLCTTGLCG